VTTLSTIAPWRIFNLSPNELILINLYQQIGYTTATAASAPAASSRSSTGCDGSYSGRTSSGGGMWQTSPSIQK